jgi:hypothetical protein
VIKKIKNTYKIHCVEPRKSIVRAIKWAIENVDWEITTPEKKKSKPMPKSVAMQRQGKRGQQEYTPEQIAAAKEAIERNKKVLYGDEEGVS